MIFDDVDKVKIDASISNIALFLGTEEGLDKKFKGGYYLLKDGSADAAAKREDRLARPEHYKALEKERYATIKADPELYAKEKLEWRRRSNLRKVNYPEIKCAHCSVLFKPKKSDSRCCGKKCSQLYRYYTKVAGTRPVKPFNRNKTVKNGNTNVSDLAVR